MTKRIFLIGLSVFLLALPIAALAANVPVKVYENGANNSPIVLPGVKVEVFSGFAFKALLSSGVSGSDGGCVLSNVPLGKEVVVKLSKTDYVTQYDIRSYSETDVENGVILWTGSEANVTGLYKKLGEAFDVKKGQVYLDINNELTGEGIDGVQFSVSSGKVFDLGSGEYLIANAEGSSLKVEFQKPGYAFDIESVTIPLFAGAMTQSYVNVQTGGAVYESAQVTKITSALLSGFVTSVSKPGTPAPISGVSVAFMSLRGIPLAPTVTTDKNGFYKQTIPVNKLVKVTPTKAPFKFKSKTIFFGSKNKQVDLQGK